MQIYNHSNEERTLELTADSTVSDCNESNEFL